MKISSFKTIAITLIVNILLLNNVLAADSVLSSGVWYKMSVGSTGMYSISYSELKSMGVDVNNVNPRNIRLYHNGGGVLPAIVGNKRTDDLVEIPIIIYGESDGRFDDGDLIVFYARGPVTWRYNANLELYEHVNNPYSDHSYVFMTVGDTPGKRIETVSSPTGETVAVDEFIDGACYDKEEFNLLNMGRTWYFDKFDITLSRSYSFSFPNVVTGRKAKLRSELATRNPSSVSFKYKLGGTSVATVMLSPMGSTQYTYAKTASTDVKQFNINSSSFNIDVSFERSESSSVGWLNFIEVNAWRSLRMSGDVMTFRNPECTNPTSVYEYRLSNAGGSTQVWDVTNPTEPKKMDASMQSSVLAFKVAGTRNNEFVAFTGNSFSKTTFVGTVQNQNLHALKDVDYLIITHPNFESQAQRLKNIHNEIDDLVIEIVKPQTIYNEFSCGAQDVSAIRDFIKNLHDNSQGEHQLKYVLLLGDASYAYKNSDVCFVPTYESVVSLSLVNCIATDDYFGCLDPSEGEMESGESVVDIAIGRMPVSTPAQATTAIDKIVTFLEKNEMTMNKWRNVITMVCDDAESGSFLKNSETISNSIYDWGGEMVVDKLYLDAYEQVATASGQRCPDFNEALTNRIENGTLIVNYIGHGGEIGWADERILTNEDINSWQNMPMLPIFITATCEFSRFDDHTRTSAGELLYLNEKGGAINMITTARTTNGSDNQRLEENFYRSVFKMYDGEYQRIGDVYKAAKQGKDLGKNAKVFVLFGDPALRIAYPKNNVVLTKLNGVEVGSQPIDTLKALSTVELEGEVRDNFNCLMDNFNGVVHVSIYDKANIYRTHGDHGCHQYDFELRDSRIYSGKAEVKNGIFDITLTLPKDIKYNYGNGLINFYATDYVTDANGNNTDIIVGGYDESVTPDEDGPEVRLYIDDEMFVSGGITNENPVIIAKIRDEKGINTSGTGIGHDIMAMLRGATEKSYNLNNYYDAPFNLDEYGTITYRLYNLNSGEHTLKLRVWDIFNNSTTVSVDFTVVKSGDGTIAVENLANAPNPMTNETRIMFEHNQKETFDVCVRIFNISGQLVRTINESRGGTSMRIDPIVWDGTNDNGSALPDGIYIYNVMVSNSRNETASAFSKLMIAR